jgi:hypothetical protein
MSSLPSLLIDYKKQVSLLSISMFYTPILLGYDSFVESTRQAEEMRKNDEYSSDDYSNALIETMDVFNADSIKNLINNTIIEYTNGWNSNAIDDFIKNNYISASFNCDEYAISEVEIQQLRDKLFSFFKIFENQLNGMSNCLQKVENIVKESDDLANNLRGGLTGGAIGGIIGSFLLPGIGTVAGAAAGGYFLNKNKSDKTQSTLINIYNDYIQYSNEFIELLRKNASNFLVISEHFTTYIYESRLNKLYYQANATNLSGEEIVINFLKSEINEGNLLLQEKIDVEDENSDTFQDWASYTHQFITH